MDGLKSRFGLNAATIKIIAVVLMVLDHIHQMFVLSGVPVWLTWLGRPVIIMFLFASAESFYYMRSKKKYLIRLLIFSLAMAVINMVLQTSLPFPVAETGETVALMNNAFGTFFIAGIYMLFWDTITDGIKNRKAGKIIVAFVIFFTPVLAYIPIFTVSANFDYFMEKLTFGQLSVLFTVCSAIPNVITVEGGPLIVMLGLVFYIFRKRRLVQIAALLAVSILYFFSGNDASNQWLMIFAAIPMLLYSGEKGRGMKWFFYIFYPVHIYLLYIIAWI
ncbi:MAG: conjugal transfer protein TraX, partial [Oscillospiraceae bacterium]|nr:conjugal transfer protein TraX [Oscillospiraceae bacterium]